MSRKKKELAYNEALEDAKRIAETDALTGLMNRGGSEYRIIHEIKKEAPGLFALLDINNFKHMNDCYGHTAGDYVLQKLAQIMQDTFSGEDILARFGGDEFVVYSSNITTLESAQKILDQFVYEVEKEEHTEIGNEHIHINIGAFFCDGSQNIEFNSIYEKCDIAMYHCRDQKDIPYQILGVGEMLPVCGKRRIPYERKESLQDRKTGDREILSAISMLYYGSYYIDLTNLSYTVIKRCPNEEKLHLRKPTTHEMIADFIRIFVDAKDQERMKDFMNLDTLQKRMENEQYIDCEYQRADQSWSRARFLAIRHNSKGMLTHVLFLVAQLDKNISSELADYANSKKSLSALFNHVPGGVVMYEWNGEYLKTLYISAIYEKEYGYKLNENQKGPDFKRIHPEDLKSYQSAILKALNETHELHYEFRIWNQSRKQYIWTHIDATSQVQENGTSLVFALYTDVTERKEAELAVDKRQASLEAALAVSDQICCEYDPQTHIIECLIEDNYLQLPKTVYNYPDSMIDYHFIHPNDLEHFLQTARAVDGNTTKSCTIRCLKEGEYRWFTCTFTPYYDSEKARNIAIFTMQDVTQSMDDMKNYEEQLQSMHAGKEDATSVCTINLNQDTYEMVDIGDGIKNLVVESSSFETVMLGVADKIVGEDVKDAYRKLFCRDNLLKRAEAGNMYTKMEYLIELGEHHYEWMTAYVDLVQNPITEEYVGVAYSRISRVKKMKQALLSEAVKQDYLFAAIIYKDTDEFYLYDTKKGQFGDRRVNYWNVAINDIRLKCSEATLANLKSNVTKENILMHLETEADYSYSYDSMDGEKTLRLEMRFSYADEAKTMILASMRNITDLSLLEKFRHDSEHDPLTDLYNRKTAFRKSYELLIAHPEVQFVMLHADLRHFRLYNTFFGESAGDKLLCEVADMFRWMSNDYDYWVYGRIEADVFCAFFPYDKDRYQRHTAKVLETLKNCRKDFLVEVTLGMYFVTDRKMPIDAMFTRATLAAKAVQPTTPYATVVYDETFEKKLDSERQVMNDMQKAIDEEQFEVYLQPKYALRTNKPVGAEALVRWKHPERGMISPGAFIPVFERDGFIMTLDRYMWEHVCMLLSKWKQEGKTMAPVSVNVSRLSMYSKATVDFLKSLLVKYSIEPKYFELELTESAYIDDPEEMKKQMLELQKAGFTILMDDFGSGYSSLNTLRELPVDILKLDMKFLSLEHDERGSIVISSIIRMAKMLNLVVVAEGVETQEQADYLKSVGCEYVQGYLFARPMPVPDYEKILENMDQALILDNTSDMEHLNSILVETNSVAHAMRNITPTSLACMECSDGMFRILRANPEFLTEFHLEEDLRPASKIFIEHMPEDSVNEFIQALEDSMKNHKKTNVSIVWNNEDGSKNRYCCRISYEGNIGNTAVFLVAFMGITDEMPESIGE